ncbi:MAG: PrsW family intramembrane metalloprotease [Acidimicrobiales bacterium]
MFPTFAWLDRVNRSRGRQPLPRRCGATVAGTVAAIVNTIVALGWGDNAAAVVSAPLVEEAMKGAGILWAVRRREVDGVMDGIVYAGWVALGFAVVEDFTYFADAASGGMLLPIFILRALLTPFAHPLFTSWTGLAVGLAVARGRSVVPALLWGYPLAVACHAAWNGSLVYAESTGDTAAIWVAYLCFVALFLAAIVTVILIRQHQRRQFEQAVPMLAARYGIPPHEAQVFARWREMLRARRRLNRSQRRHFDAVHASLARLALLHARPGPLSGADEQRLAEQLQRARTGR